MNRVARVYLPCIVMLHMGLLVQGIFVHGPGWDEVGHLPAGLSHWHTGRFDLYRVNPPLVRMIAAAPLAFQDVGIEWKWNPVYNWNRPEWDLGKELIETHGREYLSLLRQARLACLPFSLLGLWIVWRWSADLFGPLGGMLSVTVWAASPIVLTNAQMITPDLAAATLGATACYAFRRWISGGSLHQAFSSGLLLGLAELTKLTWIILFAVWPVQWLLTRRLSGSQRPFGRELAQLALLFSVCVFVINLGYGFEGSFKRLGSYEFYSRALGGRPARGSIFTTAGNRFAGTILADVPVPLPMNMVTGIDRQKVDFESGFPSYLRGEWRKGGWWYYYLYGLLVKEPTAYLVLALLAVVTGVRCGFPAGGRVEALNLLLPAVTLFVFVSSQTGFNHHLRYVLPALIFAAIGLGVCCRSPQTFPATAVTACVLAGVGALASLLAFPHSHSYFNSLAGGPRNGPRHLLNSNIDWGQDILLLETWAREHPDKPLDGVVHSLPVWLGVRELTTLPRADVPKLSPLVPGSKTSGDGLTGPVPGRYAISVVPLYQEQSGYEYFRRWKPVDQIGHTIFVFEVTREQANQVRADAGLPLLPEPASRDFPEQDIPEADRD